MWSASVSRQSLAILVAVRVATPAHRRRHRRDTSCRNRHPPSGGEGADLTGNGLSSHQPGPPSGSEDRSSDWPIVKEPKGTLT